jgi:hypothetical protein
MNKILKIIKEVVLKTIVGLLIFGGFLGIALIIDIVGEKLGLSENAQSNIYCFLFILVASSLVAYNLKKAGKLNLKYFKNLIKDIFQTIIALGGSILFIIVIIGAGIAIFNLATGIVKLGTIPAILIIILIVVGSRLERIENELRELRASRENRHNDYE